MSGFQNQTTSPATTAPDPHKHVKYSLGMVLGVDDFDQEFAYLSNRDQWLARDTIGYGTVCGLKMSIETDERGPRVSVEPGVALNPRGQLLRVTPAQCAYLNDWLDAHREDLIRELGSPPADQVTLYVVLCYRECPTEPVPIPGEPCRDETEATVNSRLEDDFKLELRFWPPDQTEEAAVRDFVEWMSHIEISDGATSLSMEDFLAAIRDSAQLGSPPSPPSDFMYGSPPSGIVINNADACEYLRAAMRVWVTELRPLWRGAACDGSTPDEECVLLAQLDVPLADGLVSSNDSVIINEEQRPYLVHLQMLQEWLLCGPKPTGGGSSLSPASAVIEETTYGQASSVGTLVNQYALADHTHGTPPSPALPPGAEPGDTVVSEMTFGQGSSPGTALQYSRVDHTHGTPLLQLPPSLEASNNVVSETTFGQMPNAGTALQYSRADHTHGTPASQTGGDFVEHPVGLPRYAIVAAGIVRGDGTSQFPTYNDLIAQQTGSGLLNVMFGGYTDPDGKFLYIIKAMPVFNDMFTLPAITFLNFGNGINLRVTEQGQPIDDLNQMEFVIEVSQYDFVQSIQPMMAASMMATSAIADRPLVNLNTASVSELRTLPRIGPELANRIVAFRKKTRGGFKSLNDLTKVEGIGEEVLRVIEPFVTL
jgi:competence ComEA-like helix-hairpin-helix protein